MEKKIASLSQEEFLQFRDFISQESGLYFDTEKIDILKSALGKRLAKQNHSSFQEYYNFLKFHPKGRIEAREFLDLVTIGETYFFRNKHSFDVLMWSILPEIIQRKIQGKDKSICVWSAGCSNGDEAYSIAIAIIETLPDYKDWNISVFGTDLNRQSITRAKEGIYTKKSVSHLPQEYIDKYFQKRGDNFILDDSIKGMVNFESHNLAKDPFFLEGMQNLDIIFCRNVTIYFDFETTKRIINSFYNCLSPGGYLFIGHAETLWQVTDKFMPIEFAQAFVYKKELKFREEIKPFIGVPEIGIDEFSFITGFPSADAVDNNAAAASKEAPAKEVKKEKKPAKEEALYKKAVGFIADKDYGQAMQLLDKITENGTDYIPAYFAKANIFANQAQYKQAIEELKKIIEVDNLFVEAYYLLGVLFYKTDDLDSAEKQFEKVIYVDQGVELAYYNLGNIYLCQKKLVQAENKFKNALSLLEKKSPEEQIRFGEDIDPDFLRRACRKNIEEIKRLEASAEIRHQR